VSAQGLQKKHENLDDFHDFIQRCQDVKELLSLAAENDGDMDERTMEIIKRIQVFVDFIALEPAPATLTDVL